jgi:hypothetical protein
VLHKAVTWATYICWYSKYGEQKESRGECETDTPSAKKRFKEETDDTGIGGEKSSGFEEFEEETNNTEIGGKKISGFDELTDGTEIGVETRRDEVCLARLIHTHISHT